MQNDHFSRCLIYADNIALVEHSADALNGKSVPHCWGREGSTQFAQQLESTVTDPSLVGCVVWSQAQSLSSSQTTSREAKPTQHIEITHPNNVNLKLAFHKVASFHPHYLTFTPQIYHHPVHRFRSWPTQMTSPSHPHTQARMQLT